MCQQQNLKLIMHEVSYFYQNKKTLPYVATVFNNKYPKLSRKYFY